MTSTSTAPCVDSNLSPSCSWTAYPIAATPTRQAKGDSSSRTSTGRFSRQCLQEPSGLFFVRLADAVRRENNLQVFRNASSLFTSIEIDLGDLEGAAVFSVLERPTEPRDRSPRFTSVPKDRPNVVRTAGVAISVRAPVPIQRLGFALLDAEAAIEEVTEIEIRNGDTAFRER